MTRFASPKSLLVTHTEEARLLGVGTTTVRQMIAGGRLQDVRISAHSVRATVASVMAVVTPPPVVLVPKPAKPAPVPVRLTDQEVLLPRDVHVILSYADVLALAARLAVVK
jgi:hypothetical protein